MGVREHTNTSNVFMSNVNVSRWHLDMPSTGRRLKTCIECQAALKESKLTIWAAGRATETHQTIELDLH